MLERLMVSDHSGVFKQEVLDEGSAFDWAELR